MSLDLLSSERIDVMDAAIQDIYGQLVPGATAPLTASALAVPQQTFGALPSSSQAEGVAVPQ